jgi:hypothetical protein
MANVLTDTHDDAIAEAMYMISVLLWSEAQISYQLNCLGILDGDVLCFAYLLLEPLVDDLTK